MFFSERPAAIPVEVKSIDDTSNFDDFPDVELKIRMFIALVVYYIQILLMFCFCFNSISFEQRLRIGQRLGVYQLHV